MTFLRRRDLSYVQDRGHVNQVKGKKTPRVKRGVLFVGRLKAIEHVMRFALLFIHRLLSSSILLLWLLTSDPPCSLSLTSDLPLGSIGDRYRWTI